MFRCTIRTSAACTAALIVDGLAVQVVYVVVALDAGHLKN